MSEVRGRKADDSAEKPDNAQTIKEGYGAGAGAAGAVAGAALLGYGVGSETTRRKLDKEQKEDYRKLRQHIREKEKTERTRLRQKAKTQKMRRRGGGGGIPTTTGLVGKAVEKFFKRT